MGWMQLRVMAVGRTAMMGRVTTMILAVVPVVKTGKARAAEKIAARAKLATMLGCQSDEDVFSSNGVCPNQEREV
ncbi:hypothetical protein DVH05_005644 [Phytophthora capsici]|nr:hypothetical protein DVH05_005644 [Phytophthora capsici]